MKISRNAPCPCGSGKKYKKCCGAADNRLDLSAVEKSSEDYVFEEIVDADQFSIIREVESLINRAVNDEARVIQLGALILFSTDTGDAWMLDAEDGTALCPAYNGERQPFTIRETETNYGIECGV